MRFSAKTYLAMYTGLAIRTYINAESRSMAWTIHNGLWGRDRSENFEQAKELTVVEDVPADVAAANHDPENILLAMWRHGGAQYDWWMRDVRGQIQHVPNLCAVAVLVQNAAGEFATVASVKRGGKLGFPAGGIEYETRDGGAPENPYHAASRELFEETGLRAWPFELRFLGATLIGGTDMVAYFTATNFGGGLRSSEEGVAAWSRPEDLVGDLGAYPDRNAWALSKLGVQGP